jgi:hypothetical protein
MIRKLVAIALLTIAFIGMVQAQDRKAAREACAADARKLCADVQRGGGRIIACLRQHDAELAPGCRDALAAIKAPPAK